MISAVIDPSVLISAFIGRPDAGPGQVVAAWRDGRFTLVVSPLLLAELAEVLARPKFARWAGEDRGSAYVTAFAARSDHRPDAAVIPSSVRDPDDDYLVALARTTNADALVSIDRDLLDAPIDDITICTPTAFLQRLASV